MNNSIEQANGTDLLEPIVARLMPLAYWMVARLTVHNTLTVILTTSLFLACLFWCRSSRQPNWRVIRWACWLPIFWALSVALYDAYVEWQLYCYMRQADAFSAPQSALYLRIVALGKVRTALFGFVCGGALWRFFTWLRAFYPSAGPV